MNRSKVVFCTDGIFPHAVGGMQRHSRLLIEALAQRGNTELVVIHPHKGLHVFEEYPDIQEITVDPLPKKQNYLIELYKYSQAVFEELTAFPNHLIYSQGLSVWYNADKVGERLIINPHGLEPYQGLTWKDSLKGWPYRMIFGRLFNIARYTVALGGKLTTILNDVVTTPSKEVIVLPNAVNLPEGAEPKTDFATPIRCLFVGRFAENKGIDVLMDAIEMLQATEHKDRFHFTLAGKGPLYNEYIEKYKLEKVDFLGFVPDEQLEELYQQHHVFVLPTRFEGMPTVVLEAMSYGMPIVVTDVGATRELVDDSNGYIIPQNAPEAIVNTLTAFADLSLEKKKSLSINSIEKVRQAFTWSQVAKRHEAIFEKMEVSQMIIS